MVFRKETLINRLRIRWRLRIGWWLIGNLGKSIETDGGRGWCKE